jgi:hypothetical protein
MIYLENDNVLTFFLLNNSKLTISTKLSTLTTWNSLTCSKSFLESDSIVGLLKSTLELRWIDTWIDIWNIKHAMKSLIKDADMIAQ